MKSQKRKKSAKDAGTHPAAKSAPLAPSTWILLGLVLVLAGVGTLAWYEHFVWNKVPPELVGLWEVNEGPQQGGTFEFLRDGTMAVNLGSKKQRVTHKAPVT